MAIKNKYYTIWNGDKPGIYAGWETCKKQIKGIKGAQYMGFPTRAAAQQALDMGYKAALAARKKAKKPSVTDLKKYGQPNMNSIAVDAASSGNPGKMEYQGVVTGSGKRLFHQGPFEEGTNNIGEFLAIVHGLAFLQQRNSDRIIYTDSRTAMSWVRKKHCNTKLVQNERNVELFELIKRAETWLKKNSFPNKIVKWETKAWGEIPADFGRK